MTSGASKEINLPIFISHAVKKKIPPFFQSWITIWSPCAYRVQNQAGEGKLSLKATTALAYDYFSYYP